MTITHHPDQATLMGFAAGGLGEALSAVVAAHAAVCPHCEKEIRDLELVGGALMGALAAAPGKSARPAFPPYLETIAKAGASLQPRPTATEADAAPHDPSRVLGRRLGIDLDAIDWKWLGPGVWHRPIKLSGTAGGDLRLLRVAPGRKVPEHGHGGTELTLVLKGAYRDDSGVFGVGDIEDVDSQTQHQPLADKAVGCICLLASEKPARFKGVFSRLLQPLIGL